MSLAPQLTRENEYQTESRRYRTIIFNNDHTPMDLVMIILMRATGCEADEAYIETMEAHSRGQADVHFSSESECHRAAAIIASIGVKTEVKPEWDED